MASNWISDVAFDAQGRPFRTYLMDGPNYRKGDVTYVSPAEVHPQNTSDPRLLEWAASHGAPSGGFVKSRGTWNSKTGTWDQGLNGGNLLALGIGGAIAAPFLAPALGGLGGGAGAGAGAGAGSTAGTVGTGAAVAKGGVFGGISVADLLKGGSNAVGMFLNNRANNRANAQSAASEQAALDFARKQYEESKATDENRYNAYEARRTPYREASKSSLAALRKLVGL